MAIKRRNSVLRCANADEMSFYFGPMMKKDVLNAHALIAPNLISSATVKNIGLMPIQKNGTVKNAALSQPTSELDFHYLTMVKFGGFM